MRCVHTVFTDVCKRLNCVNLWLLHTQGSRWECLIEFKMKIRFFLEVFYSTGALKGHEKIREEAV